MCVEESENERKCKQQTDPYFNETENWRGHSRKRERHFLTERRTDKIPANQQLRIHSFSVSVAFVHVTTMEKTTKCPT